MARSKIGKREIKTISEEAQAAMCERIPRSPNSRVWNLPNSHRVHVLDEEPEKGGPRPHWAATLITELGMPSDAKWARLTIGGAQLANGKQDCERWRDYSVEFFGMVVEPSHNGEYPWPFWKISDPNGRVSDLVIQLWRQIVTYSQSRLFLEILWHPERGRTVSIRGLENRHNATELSLVWRGLELLQSLVSQGRRPGSTALTQEEFRVRAPIACRDWMDQFDGKCRDLDLAEALDISTSTLYIYMKRDGLLRSMKSIREEAKKLLPA